MDIKYKDYHNNYVYLEQLKGLMVDMDKSLDWILDIPANNWNELMNNLKISTIKSNNRLKVLVNNITVTRLYNKLKGIDLI